MRHVNGLIFFGIVEFKAFIVTDSLIPVCVQNPYACYMYMLIIHIFL